LPRNASQPASARARFAANELGKSIGLAQRFFVYAFKHEPVPSTEASLTAKQAQHLLDECATPVCLARLPHGRSRRQHRG